MLKCYLNQLMPHLDPLESDLVANSELFSELWLPGRYLNIIEDKSTNFDLKTLSDYNVIFKWKNLFDFWGRQNCSKIKILKKDMFNFAMINKRSKLANQRIKLLLAWIREILTYCLLNALRVHLNFSAVSQVNCWSVKMKNIILNAYHFQRYKHLQNYFSQQNRVKEINNTES